MCGVFSRRPRLFRKRARGFRENSRSQPARGADFWREVSSAVVSEHLSRRGAQGFLELVLLLLENSRTRIAALAAVGLDPIFERGELIAYRAERIALREDSAAHAHGIRRRAKARARAPGGD